LDPPTGGDPRRQRRIRNSQGEGLGTDGRYRHYRWQHDHQLRFLPHYPLWSLVIIVAEVGVIWALTTYRRDAL
jgi:hypothetical protein